MNSIDRKRSFISVDNSSEPVIINRYCYDEVVESTLLDTNNIVFVLEGKCKLSGDHSFEITLNEKEFAFLPYGHSYRGVCDGRTHVVIIIIKEAYHIHQFRHLIDSRSKRGEYKPTSQVLTINDILENYLFGLELYLTHQSAGVIHNKVLYVAKVRELFHILEQFYTHQELVNLLSLIFNFDFDFAGFVLENWKTVKNANELTRLSSYCKTTFNDKFRKVFCTIPFKWLNTKRCLSIYRDVLHTDNPFKVIADKYNFNTLQHFNDYCVRNFKVPPGTIRYIK